ncbi:hypothetical protein HDU87_008313 [Geranomyces variabilis]|uniref:Uncharacterized protein n=1 Tax=Geranomyces variabilis TaxID=109894 RepID=A0AAD5TIG8_9FUNG|nr:hypothetical protein HDU87_008313 [Geranomyces variabilis]
MTSRDPKNLYATLKNTADAPAAEPGFANGSAASAISAAPLYRPFGYASEPEQLQSPTGGAVSLERKMKTKYPLLPRRGEMIQPQEPPQTPPKSGGPLGAFYTPYSPSSARTLNFKRPSNVPASSYDVRVVVRQNHKSAQLPEQ